ncbi:MAG: hypothetical protein HWE21_15195 [Cytophagia bacterium]|nr:hypothetical protein [Cytophagia bacterium]NVK85669.1 hypothetical protein [Cytophagia bacterium]
MTHKRTPKFKKILFYAAVGVVAFLVIDIIVYWDSFSAGLMGLSEPVN